MSEGYYEIEDRIEEACSVLLESKKLNVAATARQFAVPEGRLRARWKGRQAKSARLPTNTKLTKTEELAVGLYLKRLDQIGTSARLSMVTDCANSILKRNCLAGNTDTPPPTVSHSWTSRFLERNPQFHIRKQKTLDQDRRNTHNKDNLLDWFVRYKEVWDKKGIQPGDLYNFDETGFRIGVGKDQWIVTLDPSRQAYLGSSTNRELVTSCEVISGDGVVLPPMIILPGTLHMEDWTTKTNLEDDVLLAVSDTGYSNDTLCLEWLYHFDKFSARRMVGAYRLLLLDGHGSHCTREFISFCDEKLIIPFCLPPHTTHLLQPLDVVVFQPLKHFHAEAIDQATRSGCSDFNKIEFLSAITSIRSQAFKPTTIISSFRKTGLLPYCPAVVLDRFHEFSTPTSDRPTTPPRSLSLIIPVSTPYTMRSLKRQVEYLQDANPVSPTFKVNLNRFIKGSLTQADMGAQACQDLQNTQGAELARATRQNRSRRSLQNGGVLYVHEARGIVSKKIEVGALQKVEDAAKELERLIKVANQDKKKRWKPIFRQLRDTTKRQKAIPKKNPKKRRRRG